MKVTRFFVIYFLIILAGCNTITKPDDELAYQQQLDSIASARIDSAYMAIGVECDSLQKIRVPRLVDSILHSPPVTP